MNFRQHAKKMRRRRHILRQLKDYFPTLPEGGRFRFNNTCSSGAMVQNFKTTVPPDGVIVQKYRRRRYSLD